MIDDITKITNPVAALAVGGGISYNVGFFYPSIPFDILTMTDITFSIIFLIPIAILVTLVYLTISDCGEAKKINLKSTKRSMKEKIDVFLGVLGFLMLIIGIFFYTELCGISTILIALALIINAVTTVLPKSPLTPALLLLTIFITIAFFGAFQRETIKTKVTLQLKNKQNYQGDLIRNLDRGCLIKSNNQEIELILWGDIQKVSLKKSLNIKEDKW